MKPIDQLLKWQKGESIHNIERDECCPDFSCCDKDINTSQGIKDRFVLAHLNNDEEAKERWLNWFLNGMLTKKSSDSRIYWVIK